MPYLDLEEKIVFFMKLTYSDKDTRSIMIMPFSVRM